MLEINQIGARCKAHGGDIRCSYPGCIKSARDKSDRCNAHGGGKRCIEKGCTKSAINKTNKCVSHGGGNRCPNCIDWIDSRGGLLKYDNYCATYINIFPSDPRSKKINIKSKEIRVRNAIIEKSEINDIFKGFIHDRSLWTGNCDCTHRHYINHRKLIGNTILAIETDENAHKNYDKKDEKLRYDDLHYTLRIAVNGYLFVLTLILQRYIKQN